MRREEVRPLRVVVEGPSRLTKLNVAFSTPRVQTGIMSEFVDLFTRAAKAMRYSAEAAFSRHGVRVGQNLVLDALWGHDGLTPGEIAQRLHVATPTVVKMATRMETAGLLRRRRDARDARLVRLYLTDRGRSLQDAIEREIEGLEERATAGLTAEERRHLDSALAKMVRNLQQVPPSETEEEGIA
jgi:MarR family transcriptional regulator, organic hydroperoxide resistance regulator